jgi:thiol-disulfide isomerase/thioredoxin
MRSKGIGSIILVFMILLLPLKTSLSAQENKICLYFFYGAGCPDCARVEPQISQLQQNYPQLDVHSFEIYGNGTNLQLLNRFFDKYNVPQEIRKIPAAFISNTCLTGDKQILDNLEETIITSLEKGSPRPSLDEEGKSLHQYPYS